MFSGYTDKMPKWLAKEAKKETDIIQSMLGTRGKRKIKLLDVGCGDCRVFKLPAIALMINIKDGWPKAIACDIFEYEELPSKFKFYLAKNKITYKKVPSFPLTWHDDRILQKWGKFDIITCLGVDSHLSDAEASSYIHHFTQQLNPKGMLIWQAQRDNTIKGQLLKWKDRKFKYNYRDKRFYLDRFDKRESTKISYIYLKRNI